MPHILTTFEYSLKSLEQDDTLLEDIFKLANGKTFDQIKHFTQIKIKDLLEKVIIISSGDIKDTDMDYEIREEYFQLAKTLEPIIGPIGKDIYSIN